MRLLLLPILFLLLASPVAAQENMPHPRTGEDGAWIPRWLQKDHLKLEIDLKNCRLEKSNQQKRLVLREKEADQLRLGLDEEKEASQALAQVLAASEHELQEEKEHNDALTAWLWGTGSAAVVATAILVLVVAL